MTVDSLPPAFHFIVLVLACFRLQRMVTKDSWYPTQAFREYLHRRARSDQAAGHQTIRTELAELFSCLWCLGFWTCILVFSEYYFLSLVPIFVYAILAASAVVGLLGTFDGD